MAGLAGARHCERMNQPLAMQFVVRESGVFSVESMAIATATACLRMLDHAASAPELQARVDAWTSMAFRKIVRRAKGSRWDRAEDSSFPHVRSKVGDVDVLAFVPASRDALPKEISSLQVSGHKPSAQGPVAMAHAAVEIVLNKDLGMSPGKAAAAAAHVAQLTRGRVDVNAWRAAGYPMCVRIASIPRGADVVINDAGLTEVPSGSVTAVGFLR